VPATDQPVTASLDTACDAIFTFDAPTMVGLVRADAAWTLLEGPPFEVPEDLIGFVAPSEWEGLAVVATGVARRLNDLASPKRTRLTFALDRHGRSASTITTVDGTTRVDHGDESAVGLLADVCHRILGLPAAPESTSPMDVVSAIWLADVLSAHHALGDGFPLDDWRGIVSLHPFDGAADERSWHDIHQALVGSGRGWDALDPADVAWTDPPTLARLMLATLPPLWFLMDEIARIAPPQIDGRVRDLVRRPGHAGTGRA